MQAILTVTSQGLGFLSLNGETKLQLVPKWDTPPMPTASLMSIASRKGLVAAAGPDAVHIATTDSVRKAITAESSGGADDNIRPFTPQIKIPMPLRVSQLAFTADEAYLVLSAETGGGLAVYDVQPPQGGNAKAAFELSTNGETLRSLVVNPMADKAELCAVVTANGNLLVADLQQRSLRNGPSGQPVLRSQVSCVAWSSKGKQLVAGCADGSFYQMTPDGQEKAHIPKPPQLGDYYVSSIAWLENDVFLVVHNPTTPGDQSVYHIVTRHAKAGVAPEFVYQKLNDPVEPFADKVPHHTILRLRDFPPNLQDLLLVASTAVENIGLLSRSKTPLASNVPAEKITGVFTTTEFADDSKRAQLPMSSDYNDTFPIGAALDLSSTEKVPKPIPTDEMDESPGPLPALWVLNNEGVLLTWWVVYNESIRADTAFSGLTAVSGGVAVKSESAGFASPRPAAPAFGSSATPASPAPAFGASAALGSNTSPWGKPAGGAAAPAAPASRAPAFGAPSVLGSGSAMGTSPGLGAKPSVWGSGVSTSGPAFGQSSFGTASATPAAAPSGGGFSAFASNNNASPFGSVPASSDKPSGASPFGAFGSAAQSGFASLGTGSSNGGSVFATKPSGSNPFAASNTGASVFGASGTSGSSAITLFPAPAQKPSTTTGVSAFGSSPFVLGTTFKADPASANDNEKTPEKGSGGDGGSLFGSGFGLSLTGPAKKDAAAEEQKDEDMDAPVPTAPTPPPASQPAQPAQPASSVFESTTPTTTPAPSGSRFFSPLTSNDNTASKSLFGNPSGTSSTPSTFGTASAFSKPSGTALGGSLFGNFGKPSGTTPGASLFGSASGTAGGTGLFGKASTTTPSTGLFSSLAKPSTERSSATDEKQAEKPSASEIGQQQQAPLPPDISSKAPYPLGDFSSSSGTSAQSTQSSQSSPALATKLPSNKAAEEDAPLPPDPFSSEATKPSKVPDAPLPPDPFAKPKTTGSTLAKAATPEDALLPPDPFAMARSKSKPKAEEAPAPAPASSLFSGFKSSSKPAAVSIFSSAAPPSSDPGIRNPFANLPKPPVSPTTDGSDDDDFSEDDGEDEEAEEDGEGDEDGDESEEEGDQSDGEDDEGSGTDVGKDLSRSTTGLVQTPSFTAHGSFTTLGAGNASVSSAFSHIEPARSQLFVEQPVLRPPRGPQEMSPRSPSPQRPKAKPQAGTADRLFREDSQRSFSAPGMASQILRGSTRPGQAQAAPTSEARGLGQRVPHDINLGEQRNADAARAASNAAAGMAREAAQEDSYDAMDRELDQPLPPTRQLAECLYIVDTDISGDATVPSQVEAVYRDINRMVLVLKLNSRNIDAFLRGHSHADHVGERKTEDDLDEADGWVLCDVDALGAIISRDLPTKLQQSRVKNASEILADSETLLKEGRRLQTMHDDMARIMQAQADPDQVASARALPLSAEQSMQQKDLRRTFTKFMERVVEAEQLLVLLRTKAAAVAAAAAGPGGANGKGSGVPTVDAVMRTISRMTAMAEKRSGDIDVLEAQIRKLNLGSRSREGSPFSTPQKQHQKRASLIFAPGSAGRSNHRSSVLLSSPGVSAQGTPTRKKVSGYTEDEKEQLRQKRAGRQRTLDRLEKIQQAEGPRRMPMDD